MTNKPNKWIAVVLGIFFQPLALLYVGKFGWAVFYLIVGMALLLAGMVYLPEMAGVFPLLLAIICAVHAYRVAASYPEDEPRPRYSRWYGVLGAVGVLFLITFGLRAFLIEPFRFPAGSMLPTIEPGSHLVVQKWGYGNYGTFGFTLIHRPISAPLERGDLIVFEYPEDRSVHYGKRVIGLPGDKIEYRRKKLTLNGTPAAYRPDGEYLHQDRMVSARRFAEKLEQTEHSIIVDPAVPPLMTGAPSDFPHRDRCAFDEEGMSCVVPEGHYFVLGDNRDNSKDSRYWGFVPADHVTGRVIKVF